MHKAMEVTTGFMIFAIHQSPTYYHWRDRKFCHLFMLLQSFWLKLQFLALELNNSGYTAVT